MLLALVSTYRRTLSTVMGGRCRFHPSCSCYATEALERHGALRGATLAAFRILRCNPFVPGGMDPVPHAFPRRFWRRAPNEGTS